MASRSRQTAKPAAKTAKRAPKKVTVLRPSTPAQRELLERWNLSGDVEYGARAIGWQAEEWLRRWKGDGEVLTNVANMRACARRLVLLARSLKREVVRG